MLPAAADMFRSMDQNVVHVPDYAVASNRQAKVLASVIVFLFLLFVVIENTLSNWEEN